MVTETNGWMYRRTHEGTRLDFVLSVGLHFVGLEQWLRSAASNRRDLPTGRSQMRIMDGHFCHDLLNRCRDILVGLAAPKALLLHPASLGKLTVPCFTYSVDRDVPCFGQDVL